MQERAKRARGRRRRPRSKDDTSLGPTHAVKGIFRAPAWSTWPLECCRLGACDTAHRRACSWAWPCCSPTLRARAQPTRRCRRLSDRSRRARGAVAGGGRSLSPELVPAFLPQPPRGLRGGQGYRQALRGRVRAARLPLLRQDAHRGAGAEVHQRLRARELHDPAAGPLGCARGHRLRRHRARRAGACRALGRDIHPHSRILQGRPDGPRGQVGAQSSRRSSGCR